MYEYQARIIRVVDGDTVHAEVDLGFDVRFTMKLRLTGINAPELSTPEGQAAREWLIGRLGDVNQVVTIRTEKDRTEKYGRYLATIMLAWANINAELVSEGHAVVYKP